MKNTLFATLAATAAVALASSAYAANETDKSKTEYYDNGGYESTRSSEKTTAAGTTKASESKVSVDVDSQGHTRRKIKTTNVTDPAGLLNKKAENEESQIEEKARGGFKQITTRKRTDAEGTNTTYQTTTDVDVDTAGNVTTTATTEKTVDPKGMFNETTVKNTHKDVNGQVVEDTRKSN